MRSTLLYSPATSMWTESASRCVEYQHGAPFAPQKRDEMSAVSVNGTTLYYEERGSGLPVLFIHGMCGFAEVWSDQVDRLGPGYRSVTYDRRGHTRSPLGEVAQETVELHADDAAGLIEALGLAPCIIVASSGGARIALDVVRRYPALVRGAVLSEPPAFALDPLRGEEVIKQIKPAIEAAVAGGNPAAAVDAFFMVMCPGLWSAIPEAAREPYRANTRALFGDLQAPLYQVTPDDLARIQTPCLIIRGSESMPLLRRIAGVLAEHIPNNQFIELQGSGHVTYFEKPVEFAAAVMTFVERL